MDELQDMNINAADDFGGTVIEVAGYTVRHPFQMLILRWNWKAAMLGTLLRAPIVFFSYFLAKDGLKMAVWALIALSIYRFVFGGVFGAIIQSFSRVEPAWHAVITIPFVVATLSHLMEFAALALVDYVQGSNGTSRVLFWSVITSIVSAIFNLFAMRRGALLVKDETRQPFWKDLLYMPWILLEFISFPLIWTWRRSKKS